ncbi:3-oxoadipate enol-lactonase [Schauerella aestuarii]|uniref:3-oxoadipate enol-lactonase n=1 Tax=Schauerella aestuarii TaxID=2511204 RepID=UPI0013696363|nr:3-oxoadipate enol-lactonase [Achromobacter aestuarii]MYZ43890.1 3-oxoadipate enol-lactonase [Achromobacter aestuarii]
MPYADLSQTRLYYVIDGPESAPVVVLSNSLGTSADMWARQIPALTQHFRVLRYDTRGHGASSVPEGEYTFDQLSGDVVELLNTLDIPRAHFCGLSMGGTTGLALALAHPDRVGKLVLCNTGARLGTEASWQTRIDTVRQTGLNNMAAGIVDRWLTPAFRTREPGLTQVLIDILRRTNDTGYIGNCAALRDADLRAQMSEIVAPTLVIAGTHDVAATPAEGQAIHQAIAGSAYVEFDVSHLSNWEAADDFNRTVVEFLLKE